MRRETPRQTLTEAIDQTINKMSQTQGGAYAIAFAMMPKLEPNSK